MPKDDLVEFGKWINANSNIYGPYEWRPNCRNLSFCNGHSLAQGCQFLFCICINVIFMQSVWFLKRRPFSWKTNKYFVIIMPTQANADHKYLGGILDITPNMWWTLFPLLVPEKLLLIKHCLVLENIFYLLIYDSWKTENITRAFKNEERKESACC